MDAANLGFGALIVGQIIAKEFRADWTLWGLIIWLGGLIIGAFFIYLREKLIGGK